MQTDRTAVPVSRGGWMFSLACEAIRALLSAEGVTLLVKHEAVHGDVSLRRTASAGRGLLELTRLGASASTAIATALLGTEIVAVAWSGDEQSEGRDSIAEIVCVPITLDRERVGALLVDFGPSARTLTDSERLGLAAIARLAGVLVPAALTSRRERQGSVCVLVVDEQDVVRRGFRTLLMREQWVRRCIAAGSTVEALELALRYEPKVVLVDSSLPGSRELCERLVAMLNDPRVVVMSDEAAAPYPLDLAGFRASGYLSKNVDAETIAEVVRDVAAGNTAVECARPSQGLLTRREDQILRLAAKGATNREIAAELCLSPNTVKDHTTTLYRKLTAKNRAEAVARAKRLGLLPDAVVV